MSKGAPSGSWHIVSGFLNQIQLWSFECQNLSFRIVLFFVFLEEGFRLIVFFLNWKLRAPSVKELRALTVRHLAMNRKELHWRVEEEWFAYLARMQLLGEWAGEPELFVLANALQRPIEVYMFTPELTKIETYGEEGRNQEPIRVLFHSYGHYSCLIEAEDEIVIWGKAWPKVAMWQRSVYHRRPLSSVRHSLASFCHQLTS